MPAGYDFCPVCGQDQRRRFARPSTKVVHIDPVSGQAVDAMDPVQSRPLDASSDRTRPAPSFERGSAGAPQSSADRTMIAPGHGPPVPMPFGAQPPAFAPPGPPGGPSAGPGPVPPASSPSAAPYQHASPSSPSHLPPQGAHVQGTPPGGHGGGYGGYGAPTPPNGPPYGAPPHQGQAPGYGYGGQPQHPPAGYDAQHGGAPYGAQPGPGPQQGAGHHAGPQPAAANVAAQHAHQFPPAGPHPGAPHPGSGLQPHPGAAPVGYEGASPHGHTPPAEVPNYGHPPAAPVPPAALVLPADVQPEPAPGRQRSITGRTEFVDGPPLMRPPEVREDDRTVPVPSKVRPAEGNYTPSATPTLPGDIVARLVMVARDGDEGESFPMRGVSLSLGRSEGDVTFPDDPYTSPSHARLERRSTGFTIVDLGSQNGVYLRIHSTSPVYPGDLFMVGHHLLRLENITESMREQPPSADGTRLFGTPLKPAWGKVTLIGRGGVTSDQYHLRGAKVTFGREDGDILFPNDPFVSREHARLRLEIHGNAMQVFLEDLGSANGTYIRIRGSVDLRHEDTFRIGDQILRLRLDG